MLLLIKTTKKEAWYTKELNHFNASQIARKKISFLTNFVMKTRSETIGHIKWDCGINWDSQLTGKFLKGSKTRSAACRQSRGGYRLGEPRWSTVSLYNKLSAWVFGIAQSLILKLEMNCSFDGENWSWKIKQRDLRPSVSQRLQSCPSDGYSECRLNCRDSPGITWPSER